MARDASAALSVRQTVQNFLNAACTGNLDLFKKLAKVLDEGNGVAATAADVKDANNRTALHFSAREGRTEVCQYLLEELKLDVDVKDDDGETPLIHASRQGHYLTAKYLLEQGADPSASSELGATALHHAAGIGNLELMKLLLSKGVDIESQSDAGTPLIWAAGHGQPEAVKFLLEHHAKANAETDDNITPLLSAVAAESLPCLELLLEAGADPNVSAGGATPLHVAADNGNRQIINCLIKAGGNPNLCDEDGLKPIEIAALRGNRDAIEVILPLTSPIPKISNWSIDGVIEFMQSDASSQQTRKEEIDSTQGASLQKPDIVEVTPEAKKRSLEAKSRGDDVFRKKDYLMAVDAYTQAIDLDPNEATLLSNRSLCWIRLGQGEQALADAKACRALKPDWPKGYYREGAVLRLLQRFDEAASVFYEAVELDPENKELVEAFSAHCSMAAPASPLSSSKGVGFQNPNCSSNSPSVLLSPSPLRLWRPAAQRNVRNQWSKLFSSKTQWANAMSEGRSHATSLVNAYLNQRYMSSVNLGAANNMPEIREKACQKLAHKQETYGNCLLSSYKNMVLTVAELVKSAHSFRCFLKGPVASLLAQFGDCPRHENDSGDGGGVPVFTFFSILHFENLARELVEMFVSELSLKRFLVVEFLSLRCEVEGQSNKIKWSDELYIGEFDDLTISGLCTENNIPPLFPQLRGQLPGVP